LSPRAADEQLQRLSGEACIRRLVHEYADAVLVKDADRMLSLWASELAAPAPFPDFDIDWARKLPARWESWGVTMLHVTTHAIFFDGEDDAHGRVQCIVQMQRDEGFVDQSVLYEDDYVRRGEDWLFAVRRHRLWFGSVRSVDPTAQPRSTWPASQLGAGTLPGDLQRLWPDGAARR
jgi:SnoaL-like domain